MSESNTSGSRKTHLSTTMAVAMVSEETVITTVDMAVVATAVTTTITSSISNISISSTRRRQWTVLLVRQRPQLAPVQATQQPTTAHSMPNTMDQTHMLPMVVTRTMLRIISTINSTRSSKRNSRHSNNPKALPPSHLPRLVKLLLPRHLVEAAVTVLYVPLSIRSQDINMLICLFV